MAEFSKFIKIVLYIKIIVAFICGIFYLFTPEFYAGLIDPSDMIHAFGGNGEAHILH